MGKRIVIDKTVFSINLWDVYQKEGRQCAEKGDLDGALERFQAALEKAESYGSNDPRVASSKRCVAEVFSKQGKLAEAAKLYDDALELLEQELGEDSSTLLKTLRSYAKLLTQTDIPISKIATESGFTSFNNLSRVFKKHKGTSPSDYRKSNKL